MAKFTLDIDLETNELLEKEVQEVIKSTVKHKYMGYIDSIMEETVKKKVQERITQWTEERWGEPSKMSRLVEQSIKSELTKKVFENLSTENKTTQEYLEGYIKSCIDTKFSESLKEQVTEIVQNQVFKKLSSLCDVTKK